MTRSRFAALLPLAMAAVARVPVPQDPTASTAPAPKWSATQEKAAAFLMTQQKDGVVSITRGGKETQDPAMTGFVLMALQSKAKAQRTAAEQGAIDAGAKWLLSKQNDDGTWGEQVPNYATCVAVGALHAWGEPPAKAALEKAQRAILALQHCEANGFQRGDRDYGSIGYGGSKRGDVSNTQFGLAALHDTGLPENHEALQRAIVFLQRSQNLKSVNDWTGKVPDPAKKDAMLDSASGDDGGACYYPGNSAAGYTVSPDGTCVPRSYGSVTYALLKAYTFAGVKADDPRVAAAVGWIGRHWTLDENPGADAALGEKAPFQGLYYYYLAMAQALDVMGVNEIAVDGGAKVDWRKSLRERLESTQRSDGTWLNAKNERWMEGMPLLCTCYATLALARWL